MSHLSSRSLHSMPVGGIPMIDREQLEKEAVRRDFPSCHGYRIFIAGDRLFFLSRQVEFMTKALTAEKAPPKEKHVRSILTFYLRVSEQGMSFFFASDGFLSQEKDIQHMDSHEQLCRHTSR